MSEWEEEISQSDSFDNPESCECAIVFERKECSSCGHDLGCVDAYCVSENHKERLTKSCDCHAGEGVEDCSDCYHDLSCKLSDCDNEEHERIRLFGYPKFCSCLAGLQKIECSNCGHSTICLQDECGECYEPDHSHFYTYFARPEDCECAGFRDSLRCDSCNHDLNCPENDAYCSNHMKTEYPNGTNILVDASGAQAPEASTINATSSDSKKRGSYWTREEDEELASQYLGGASDTEISNLLGRSVRAIQSRLVKICFEANGIEIAKKLIYPREAMARWAETEDHLLEGLSSTKVQLSTISRALERSELAVAFRLVARRLAKPGDLNLIYYYEKIDSSLAPESSEWTVSEYLELRAWFRLGKAIKNLAAESGKSELSCFTVLYTMGEISSKDLDMALRSAVGNSNSHEE